MENDILDSLDDLGCELIQGGDGIEKALESGPKDPLYTKLVEWLSLELKALCDLEDHVNAITEAEDSSSFLLELSSFLKELGCPHKTLMEGPVNKRLASREDRLILLDFLTTELQAARMIHVNKGTEDRSMHVAVEESPTAADLKKILVSLGFSKPPPNVTPQQLFGKVETKVKEVASKAKVGNPLFSGVLSDKQWHMLEELQKQMDKEYRIRREMLLKRLDVTILSFKWAENAKAREDEIQNIYAPRRGKLTTIPDVTLGDLLAAREDLAYIEKTSSASVRKNTSTPLNKVVIGRTEEEDQVNRNHHLLRCQAGNRDRLDLDHKEVVEVSVADAEEEEDSMGVNVENITGEEEEFRGIGARDKARPSLVDGLEETTVVVINIKEKMEGGALLNGIYGGSPPNSGNFRARTLEQPWS
ncbi:unnamed protein product [Darwinula stevensoni]|uniref:Protein FAM98A n=1 Tax=Darwinula stevensoni TaxID=69355 RepID=A0A7R8WXS5_9CRUS|nr:unnamed protein product [Darwinula stevensoni]CAG0878683.1 unnamed protein product [Darwinula stevensoni]